MKRLLCIGVLLASLFAMQACSKSEGVEGPAGKDGTDGKDGVSGARAFTYNNKTLTFAELIPVTQGFVDSSVCLVYYQDAASPSFMYQAPGFGLGSSYQTRYFLSRNQVNPTLYIYLLSPTGGDYYNPTVFESVKVVFIPITQYGKKDAVDYSDYKAVAKYYGLND